MKTQKVPCYIRSKDYFDMKKNTYWDKVPLIYVYLLMLILRFRCVVLCRCLKYLLKRFVALSIGTERYKFTNSNQTCALSWYIFQLLASCVNVYALMTRRLLLLNCGGIISTRYLDVSQDTVPILSLWFPSGRFFTVYEVL